jgi:hypothetical protein
MALLLAPLLAVQSGHSTQATALSTHELAQSYQSIDQAPEPGYVCSRPYWPNPTLLEPGMAQGAQDGNTRDSQADWPRAAGIAPPLLVRSSSSPRRAASRSASGLSWNV